MVPCGIPSPVLRLPRRNEVVAGVTCNNSGAGVVATTPTVGEPPPEHSKPPLAFGQMAAAGAADAPQPPDNGAGVVAGGLANQPDADAAGGVAALALVAIGAQEEAAVPPGGEPPIAAVSSSRPTLVSATPLVVSQTSPAPAVLVGQIQAKGQTPLPGWRRIRTASPTRASASAPPSPALRASAAASPLSPTRWTPCAKWQAACRPSLPPC